MTFAKVNKCCVKVGALAKKLHITGLMRDSPKLSLPGKLVFPRYVA